MGSLASSEGKRWLPGVVTDVMSVKVTVRLVDGRLVCRHLDHVRRREADSEPKALPEPSTQFGGGALEPALLTSGPVRLPLKATYPAAAEGTEGAARCAEGAARPAKPPLSVMPSQQSASEPPEVLPRHSYNLRPRPRPS